MNPAKSFAAIGITTDKAREAERLVAMCREDAIRAGISEQDLEDAVGGDLVSNMLEALDAAAVRAIEEATSGGILNDEAAN